MLVITRLPLHFQNSSRVTMHAVEIFMNMDFFPRHNNSFVSSISSIMLQPCGQFHFWNSKFIHVVKAHHPYPHFTYVYNHLHICAQFDSWNIISSIVVFCSYGLFHVWYASFTNIIYSCIHKYNSIVLKIPIQPFDLEKKNLWLHFTQLWMILFEWWISSINNSKLGKDFKFGLGGGGVCLTRS